MTQSPAPEEWWVLVSQDCDIASKDEPRVELMRAFWTTDKNTIRGARLNSARRYLLARRTRPDDREEGLIVDATTRLLMEKDSLQGLHPAREVVSLTQEARRRLGEWLARRYARPAIPDLQVRAIQKPLVDSLRALKKKKNDPLWEYFDSIDEVRFSVATDSPPYAVSLVCILAPGSQLEPLEEAEIRGWFDEVLDEQAQAHLDGVEFRSPESISLTAYLSYQPLPLGEFSLEED